MTANLTLQQVKNLLKQELAPVNAKLDELSKQLNEIDSTVKFLNAKYDELLNKMKNTNENVARHGSDISNIKATIKRVEKLASDTSAEAEEMAQYMRRDFLEITGVMANEDCSAEAIVTSVGNLIGVPLQEKDISVAHPISTYREDAPPKLIVKFTRRCVRDRFYSNRRKLVKKKAKDLPNLNLSSQADVFISESLTPFKKKLFGDVNKVKKKLKWKYIWTYNGRIFLRQDENKPSFSFNCVQIHTQLLG